MNTASLKRWGTLLTVPELSRARFLRQANAWEMEPLVHASLIVAGNHISVRNVVAEAVGWLLPWASRNSIGLWCTSPIQLLA